MTAQIELAPFFKGDFSPQIRRRGERYFRDRRVFDTLEAADGVAAKVRGESDTYDVQIHWRNGSGGLGTHCSCPYFTGHEGDPCKHLWAVILTFDRRGWPDSLLAAGRLPANPPPPKYEDEDDAQPADGNRRKQQRKNKNTSKNASQTKARRGNDRPRRDNTDKQRDGDKPQRQRRNKNRQKKVAWNQALSAVLATAEKKTEERGPQEKRQGWFLIDPTASLNAGKLVIRHAHRKRKKTGEWSKLTFARVSPADLEMFEDDDDRALVESLLSLRDADQSPPPHSGYGALEAPVNRTVIGKPLYDPWLKRLDQSERLACLPRDANVAESAESVSLDDGEPWQFHARMEHDDDNGYRVVGLLERDDEQRDMSDVDLLVEEGLVVIDGKLAPIEFGDGLQWAVSLFRQPDITIPEKDCERFVQAFWDAAERPALDMPEELDYAASETEARGHLAVSSRGHATQDMVQAEFSFDYDGEYITPGERRGALILADEKRVHVRDRRRETLLLRQLRSAGFRQQRQGRNGNQSANYEIARATLLQALTTLTARDWSVEIDRRTIKFAHDINLSLTADKDWFDLEASVRFDDEKVELPVLLEALKMGEPLLALSDGASGVLPADVLEQLRRLAEMGTETVTGLRFHMHQGFLIDALLDGMSLEAEYDKNFQTWRERLRAFRNIEPAETPKTFKGDMRPYQLEGLAWLRAMAELGMGGCLADDMGLGKTIQILALLDSRKQKGRPASLIVVPRSLVYNWFEEARRFTPRLKLLDYSGASRKDFADDFDSYDLVVTTYGIVRRDIETLREYRFDYTILDEAQAIKNPDSQAAKATRLLQTEHRIAMTGTPIENKLGDLLSLFEFLNPGLFIHSRQMKALTRYADDPGAAAVIGQGLRPLILRRTKEQVLKDLPPKSEMTIVCELEPEQRQLYDELRKHYQTTLHEKIGEKGLNNSKMHVLEALLRLRQAACHPGLIDEERAGERSAKLETLMAQLTEIVGSGHKALIFSQFTKFLGLARSAIEEAGIDYEYLDGRTRNRAPKIERFQEDENCSVFLISLKAGGFGLNLTAADYVFILDPWWNPAAESQAVDRAHRIGQDKPVFAYRLLCADTIEEKIAELQSNKRDLADAIVGEDNSLLSNLSVQDLETLLS